MRISKIVKFSMPTYLQSCVNENVDWVKTDKTSVDVVKIMKGAKIFYCSLSAKTRKFLRTIVSVF